jgi:hypothetical protein
MNSSLVTGEVEVDMGNEMKNKGWGFVEERVKVR